MNTSDLIAILAIILSGISIIVAYLNNIANIKAKRLEIAFTKQVDAFSTIASKMGRIRQAVAERAAASSGKKSVHTFFAELKKAFDDYYLAYQELRVFLSPDMLVASEEYGRQMSEFIQKQSLGQVKEFIIYINRQEHTIISLMHNEIGLRKSKPHKSNRIHFPQ